MKLLLALALWLQAAAPKVVPAVRPQPRLALVPAAATASAASLPTLPKAAVPAVLQPAAGVPADLPADAPKAPTAAKALELIAAGVAVVDFDGAPTVPDLKKLADLERYEVLLTRERESRRWTAWRGDLVNVVNEARDYDRAIHNHVALRLGAHSIYSPLPSPQDLATASGKDGRFFVVSRDGVAEWNSDTGGAQNRLEATALGRFIMRLTYPALYPWLLAREGVAAVLKPWKKVTPEWLESGAAPENARLFAKRMSWIPADEHAAVAARMGGAHVKPEVEFYVEKWGDRWFERWNDAPGVPDGVCWRESKLIQLFVRRHWRKLKDPETHYRVLFTHEFAHRLQFEGLWNEKYGVEMPAVAVELLRGIELVGLEELRKGRVEFIHAGVLGGFDSGVEWARSGRKDATPFFYKGAMAGAAWELARLTGRPDDAWEFVRRVSSAKTPEDPRTVYDSIMDAVKLEGASADLR